MPEPIRIRLEEPNPINVELEESQPIDIDLTGKIVLKYVEPDHPKLDHLDYEESGHTGFTPGRLNLLENVNVSTSNERLFVVANVNDKPSKISLRDVSKRIIRTAENVPDDLQVGQYLLLEKPTQNN